MFTLLLSFLLELLEKKKAEDKQTDFHPESQKKKKIPTSLNGQEFQVPHLCIIRQNSSLSAKLNPLFNPLFRRRLLYLPA